MADPYNLVRPLMMRLDPEKAHRLTLRLLKSGLPSLLSAGEDPPELATTLFGARLPNPIGLAAGFDKNAEVPDAMLRLGFGFVEVGTITPRPQNGNPPPRIFRLTEDRAVINRIGFANDGADNASKKLSKRRARMRPGKVGINIGANKDSEDRAEDYVTGLKRFAGMADYFTINISSPNTPGLRDLQTRDALADLIKRLVEERAKIAAVRPTPMMLKIAPDLTPEEIADITAVVLEHGVDGMIVSNTTTSRPDSLQSPLKEETGGLSGAPLKTLALGTLKTVYAHTRGHIPLIGVGGISSGADAYARIRAGADVVQLYSALVYEGPGLVRRIKDDLAALLRVDGFTAISDAVGADLD